MSDVTLADIQNQLEDIKGRLSAAEEKVEGKQAVGPRGAAGPPGLIGPRGEKGDSITGPQGHDGRDGRDGRTPDKEELTAIIIEVLQDYRLLDPDTALPYAGPYAKQ